MAITKVTVTMRARAPNTPVSGSGIPFIITHGSAYPPDPTHYSAAWYNLTGSYANYSHEWALNPNTGLAWTQEEIDNLQAGVSLWTSGFANYPPARCTQLFVRVERFEEPDTILRPISTIYSWLMEQYPAIGEHWDKICEAIPDEDDTWVEGGTVGFSMTRYYDIYGLPIAITAPTVTTQAASNVQATTATGNGNITDNGGENCDHRGIVYGKTSKGDPGNTAYDATDYDDYEDETPGPFGEEAFTRSLTGLDPGTEYYARAYAHNSAGYSYGGEVSFTTLAAIVAPTVTTNPATAIETTSAIPNGVLTNDGGEACEVRFQWGLTDAYGNDTPWQSGKHTTDAFEQVISGLDPNTTYHFRAQAKNSAGTANGADRSFTTSAPVPAVAINRAYALSRCEL